MTGPDAAPAGTAPERPPTPELGRTTSRSDLVESALRKMIIAGEFEPGETLVERHLAAMLGVSKTPVREALIALASSGLVQVSRNRGVVVRQPAGEDMWKVFELRLLLEPWAIGRSTERHGDEVAGIAQVPLDESAALLDSDDQAKLSLANRRFHRALYGACDNELVTAQLDRMQDLISIGFVRLWDRSSWPVWRTEYDEHCAILAAVRAGDAPAATRAAHEHISRAMTLLRQHWDTPG